jgi:hypothetical protein
MGTCDGDVKTVPEGMKACICCGKVKTLIDGFYYNGTDSRGNARYQHQCKQCIDEKARVAKAAARAARTERGLQLAAERRARAVTVASTPKEAKPAATQQPSELERSGSPLAQLVISPKVQAAAELVKVHTGTVTIPIVMDITVGRAKAQRVCFGIELHITNHIQTA